MAQREIDRDSYGEERRSAEGAGSSTSLDDTGRRAAAGERQSDAESPAWGGSESSASTSPGALRKLTDELGITQPTTRADERPDSRIREDVCERLWREHRVDVSEVSVHVSDAVVRLEGTVPHRHMKHEIEDIVASCRGVKDVENRIRVARS